MAIALQVNGSWLDQALQPNSKIPGLETLTTILTREDIKNLTRPLVRNLGGVGGQAASPALTPPCRKYARFLQAATIPIPFSRHRETPIRR